MDSKAFEESIMIGYFLLLREHRGSRGNAQVNFNTVEIFLLINFGKNLMNVTTIGFVAKLAPVIPEEELLLPIFVVREFMIQFSAPSYKM